MTSMIFPRKKGADMVMTLDTARNPTAAGRQKDKLMLTLLGTGAGVEFLRPPSQTFRLSCWGERKGPNGSRLRGSKVTAREQENVLSWMRWY